MHTDFGFQPGRRDLFQLAAAVTGIAAARSDIPARKGVRAASNRSSTGWETYLDTFPKIDAASST